MTTREVVQKLTADGWVELPRTASSHRKFVHPSKLGHIIVADHKGDIKRGTLKNILKKAGLQ